MRYIGVLTAVLLAPLAHESALDKCQYIAVSFEYSALLDLPYVVKYLVKCFRLRVIFSVGVIAESHTHHAAVPAAILKGLLPRIEKSLVKVIIRTGSVISVLICRAVHSRRKLPDVDKEKCKAACRGIYLGVSGRAVCPYCRSVSRSGILYGLNAFRVVYSAVNKPFISKRVDSIHRQSRCKHSRCCRY